MRKLSTLLVVVMLLLSVVPSFAQDSKPTKTIAEIVTELSSAKDKPEFTVLLAAVKAADPVFLQELSNKDQNLTVFAPTDAAFGELLKALNLKAEDLLANKALLNIVLAYHVVPNARLDAKSVVAADGAIVGTVLPDHALKIAAKDSKVSINDAEVVQADVNAVNGVVHVINKVLVPEDAMDLAAAMSATPAADATMEAMPAAPQTVADLVVASTTAEKPEFTTLLAAVKAADPAVLKALSSSGSSFTVFAPTDAAFEAAIKALKTTPADLLANKDLTNILLYHVAPGSLSAAALTKYIGTDGVKLVTLLPGKLLSLEIKDGKVVIDGTSTVVAADVAASNGVVHVIDSVLLPK